MARFVFTLALAAAFAAACSPESPPPSGAAEEVPASASAPAPGAAQPPTSGAAPAPAPAPSAPPAPTFRELTIPAETPISVTLVTPIASNTSKVEEQVRGTLAEAILVGGTTVVPAGSEVTGAVLEANDSGRVKGRASVAVGFDRLTVRGESHGSRRRASRARQRPARRVTSRRGPSVPARAPSSAASRVRMRGRDWRGRWRGRDRAGDEGQRGPAGRRHRAQHEADGTGHGAGADCAEMKA